MERGIVERVQWCDTRGMTADGRTKGSIDRELLLRVMAGQLSFNHELKRRAPYRPGRSYKGSPGSGYFVQGRNGMATCFAALQCHAPGALVTPVSLPYAVQQRPLGSSPSDFERRSKPREASVHPLTFMAQSG